MKLSKYKACICEGSAEAAIREYKRTANIPNGEVTLLDLLKC